MLLRTGLCNACDDAKEVDCRNGCCESLAGFGSSLIVAKKNNMGHTYTYINIYIFNYF